jgi:UDP-N-acetylglucosamine transferase subunit ALG13
MIFVTIGTQLPFDRLITNIDQWAERQHADVFAQIGNTEIKPKYIKYASYLDPIEAEKMFKESSVIISHAGMGSVLNALKYKKPLIAMPRIAAKGEHRNEHQLATAKWIESFDGVNIAWDEKGLWDLLRKLDTLTSGGAISDYASPQLIQNLKQFFSS